MLRELEGVADGNCSVCGRKMTRFGNYRLKDGMLCRKCKALISPWITEEELLEMNTEDVKAHLLQREQNRNGLPDFRPEVKVGER